MSTPDSDEAMRDLASALAAVPPHVALTGQEREVLRLYSADLPMKSVARRLGITEGTVKEHLERIRAKLAVDIEPYDRLALRSALRDVVLSVLADDPLPPAVITNGHSRSEREVEPPTGDGPAEAGATTAQDGRRASKSGFSIPLTTDEQVARLERLRARVDADLERRKAARASS